MTYRSNRLVAATLLILGAAWGPQAVRADLVYAVSLSLGGLYRFDSNDSSGTVTTLQPSGGLTLTSPSALAVGPDGNLYIGDSGSPDGSIAPKILRYAPGTNTLSNVVTLSAASQRPAAIAFKPGANGDMLVGRNPFYGNTGPVLKVTGWNGGSPAVSNYTTGTSLDQSSSPGLAVAADGTLYVSASSYDGQNITGTVRKFDSSGAVVGTAASSATPSTYGPAGLVLTGTTLYSASVQDGAIYTTTLPGPTATVFGAVGGPYEVGPLARLSGGELLAGSVSGYTGSIYRFSTAGTLLGVASSFDFGQVGGIVTVVPEPATGFVLVAGAVLAAGMVRRRGPPAAGR
ncbi:MAG: PEP-CTERM sorting domain-containing protein [Planctomycetota bacterium]|nr:MAG: PEP-CTERM sorting domain-containing protein [Planctomycetota bacterium]